MSEAFFDGYTIGTVSGVQVHRAEPTAEQVANLPTRLEGTFRATEVDTQTIAALMGLESPKEATFTSHGVTATLRNIAFHDDGTRDFPGTEGCVQMAMTMTGDLVDLHFDSPAKNRTWRRLKRRAMKFDCRWRERRRRELRAIVKKLNTYLGKTPFRLDQLKLAYAQLIRCACVSLDNLDDVNHIRERCGLPPMEAL